MKGLKKRWARWSKRLRRLLVLTLLACLAVSVLMVVPLRWIDPPVSSVMLQRFISEGGRSQRQQWVDLDQTGPYLAVAFIAAEDQRFAEHSGFDAREVIAAIERRLEGGSLRGASTITQQVARNLFLWQQRRFVRKGLEVWFTGLLEAFLPKRRILEMYLNFAETGRRLFGVGAASRHYFGVAPHRLSPEQAALIAATLPNPLRYRVDSPSERVLARRDWILLQMDNLGGRDYLKRL